MTDPVLSRRRGGPLLAVAVDAVRHARHTRNWVVLLVIALTLLAAAVGAAGQAAVPFVIYGGL